MRYNQIRELDIANGEGIGVSLFVQGCHFHCPNCFNQETWDFNGGKEWTEEIENKFLELIKKPYITRLSLLGGEPMEHPYPLFCLVSKVKQIRPDIKIYVYSGYTYEQIIKSREKTKLLLVSDVLVDGRYVDELRDLSLAYKGSLNQRIINIKETLEKGEIVCLKL